MTSLWLVQVLVLLGSVLCTEASGHESADTCPVYPPDENVYLIAYGSNWAPYEYLNEDGELMGLAYDLARSVCKLMNKKCEHVVYYDYDIGFDASGKSDGLNNGWYDAIANWALVPKRVAAYGFFGEYAYQEVSYLYVKKDSSLDTVDEIRSNANSIGFHRTFKATQRCLEKNFGISLSSRARHYDSISDMQRALRNSEVDAVFSDPATFDDDDFERVGSGFRNCALGGVSFMARKDKVGRFAWFDEGLMKLRQNGDYRWLCNINSRVTDVDIACFED